MPATATYTDRRLAGTLLILVPIVFTACFTLLQMQFEYPDILRQPTADILAKFQAGGTSLVVVWYVLTLSAVFLIPIALLLHRILAAHDDSTTLRVATAFGIIAGVAQTLGFLRWPFLVPHLTSTYFAPETSEAQRAATAAPAQGNITTNTKHSNAGHNSGNQRAAGFVFLLSGSGCRR